MSAQRLIGFILAVAIASAAILARMPASSACAMSATQACCCEHDAAQDACPDSSSCRMTPQPTDSPQGALPQNSLRVLKLITNDWLSPPGEPRIARRESALAYSISFAAFDSPEPKRYLRSRKLRL